LVFTELLGSKKEITDDTTAEWYFRSVPRSMYSIFRCSFGDCGTADGTPMAEIFLARSGGIWLSLLYSGFSFMVMIGLFNVISAIFVESTMSTANSMLAAKARERLEDPERWARNFMKLLSLVLSRMCPPDQELLEAVNSGTLTDSVLMKLKDAKFSRAMFDDLLETNEHAQQALVELDIPKAEHKFLSDILDSDNSEWIHLDEMLDGLQRLRGCFRRETIAVDMMVRSIQKKIDAIERWTNPKGDDAETASVDRASVWALKHVGNVAAAI